MPFVLLLTAALYSITFKNGFINWDDPLYITENTLIRDLSFRGIVTIFSTLHFNGFLPITQLSLALDYFFWKDNPMGYHLSNILIHLLNVSLVYFLSLNITGKKKASIITCLLFAIHPMRVESVVWAAERKDVLYAFFYFLSLLYYVKYLKNNFDLRLIFLSFIFFGFSAFSKWSAFPLPIVLILFDFYLGRKFSKRAIFEKLIFLIIPFVSVYIHFSKGTIVPEQFNLLNRLFLGSYSLSFYLVKFLFPINLSAIYPYPGLENGFLPAEYYLSALFIPALCTFFYFFIKKNPGLRNTLLYCSGFFILNLGMVLHVLSPIGGLVVTADRYSYVSFFGLFLFTGLWAERYFSKPANNPGISKKTIVLFTVVMFFYSFQTIQRINIWKDSIVFFNDIIKKDSSIAFAFNNLGFAEADNNNHLQAIVHYTKAIELNREFSFALNNRGLSLDALGKYEDAISDFNRAVSIKPEDATLYYNRGLSYYHWGKNQTAIIDISKAIEKKPGETKYYIKRGSIKNDLGDYEGAADDFLTATQLSPENAEAFNYLGLSFNYLHRLEESMEAYDKSIELSPDYSSAYNNRGWVKFTKKDLIGALNDFSQSIRLDSLYSFPYHNRGLLYYETQNPEKACSDWKIAASLGYKNSQNLIDRYCSK